MDKRIEYFVYTFFIVLAAVLSFVLVHNILTARAERVQQRQEEAERKPDESVPLPEPTPIETAIAVFVERDLFENLNVRLPTPTKVILPTPTPTVPPLCENWQVTAILGSVAQIQTGDGKRLTYREGDTVPKDPSKGVGHVIYKIDKKGKRVFVIRKTDNVMGWLYMGGGVEVVKTLPK